MKAYVIIWEDRLFIESYPEITRVFSSLRKAKSYMKKRQDEGESSHWRIEVYDLLTGEYIEEIQ